MSSLAVNIHTRSGDLHLRWDNFNETVKRVGKDDEVLGRYYDEVVAMEENPLPPLRKCTKCRCPGHTRGNCTVFVEPATHYYDGPDHEGWQRKQNEKEFMRQIAAIGKYPLGRTEYLARWWMDASESQRKRAGPAFKFFVVDFNGPQEDRNFEVVTDLIRRYENEEFEGQDPLISYNITTNVPEDSALNDFFLIHAPHGGKYTMTVTERMMQDGEVTMTLRLRKSAMQHDVIGDHHVSEASVIYMDKEDAFKKEWEGFNVFLVKRKKTPLREEVIPETCCPICMEDLTTCDKTVTRCGHQFHGSCLLKYMGTSSTMVCPCCREEMF